MPHSGADNSLKSLLGLAQPSFWVLLTSADFQSYSCLESLMSLLTRHHGHHRHLSLHGLVYTTTMMSLNQPIPNNQDGEGQACSVLPGEQIQDHLKCVYNGLRGTAPTLSREQLELFCKEIQGQAIDLAEKDDYKFEDFLGVLWYNHGFEAIKEKPPGELDTSKPISNYFISSSHNTYLSGNQLASKSSTEAYKDVSFTGIS